MIQNEDDKLLNSILETRFFNAFKMPINDKNKIDSQIELFITNECNLKCSYCYLQKYGKQLYPTGGNSVKKISENLELLFDHFLKENYSFTNIDLFSGEIWAEEMGNAVFDIILKYLDKGLAINGITIPTNFSFILDDKKIEIIESYIDKFSNLNCDITLSASIDGKYLEDETRPFKVSKNEIYYKDDNFYDKVFSFCKKYNFKYHPMVAAHGIEKWKENLLWYKQKITEYGSEDPYEDIMLLEVRNDDWTKEKIDEYIKFIDFIIEDKFELCNRNIVEFTKNLFNIGNKNSSGYLPTNLPTSNNIMPCTIQYQMTIRVGDLSIVGCHRMAYEKFVFGNYVVEDKEIKGIKSNNVVMAAKVTLCNPENSIHGCDNCLYNRLCMKGCFGAQYEATSDPFMPAVTVCDLFKAKYNYLLKKYRDMGVFDTAKNLIENNGLRYYNIKGFYDIYMKILDEIEEKERQC